MKITPLHQNDITELIELMKLGEPYIRPRTTSDYWLYANLFSSTCPIARVNGRLVGAIMAFRSQECPDDIYIQDVMSHPKHRQQGIASALLTAITDRARVFGARRLYLTSEPDNSAAHKTWVRRGFMNVTGDQLIDGVFVISDFKGPGKHRAVYEKSI